MTTTVGKDIKNLLIDFGGVLVDLNRPRCIEHFRRIGWEEAGTMLDACHQQGIFHRMDEGTITTAEFRDAIRQQIGHHVPDADIDNAWYSFLDGIPANKLELLLELKKHYHVFLLSNVGSLHWEWSCKHLFSYQGHRVEDYFERIFLSYRLKMTKPNPAIFRTVLQETGIVPAETLFIDDSAENCRVAETLGIATYTPQAHEDWSHLFR